MPKPKPTTIDFETEGIEERPLYPPKPVGVSIKPYRKKAKYYAWGHPTGNNCSKADGVRALATAIREAESIVCHNARFDADVGEVHCSIVWPWDKTHDTQVLAYLVDPHARSISLKPLANDWLGMPPEEQEAVRDWLVEHGIERKGTKQWGRSICKAPGDLVGKYADGDTVRTEKLFDRFYDYVVEHNMLGAYNRELRLLPVLLTNEREGVQVDAKGLKKDIKVIRTALQDTDQRIRNKLGVSELNIDSDASLADAIDKYQPGIAWPLTPTGLRSTTKDALHSVLGDQELLALLQYRASMLTCVGTFMEPWLATAEQTGGRIHTTWHSTRGEGGGSRTGRLSSSPNFQNMPTLSSPRFAEVIALHAKYLAGYGLPALPAVRSYIVADTKNHVILDRDFSQQELRVLAHFESGAMMNAYLENPTMDLHQFAADTILEILGIALTRKATKTLAFGILYGMGLGALAERLAVTVKEAKDTKGAYMKAFPGIKEIQDDLKTRARNELPMRTWGGREYFVEPPKMVKGERRTFDYKLFNYLIQGSSADITKEAVLRYNETKKDGRLLLTVHDQLLACAPKAAWKSEMTLLKEAMEGIALDVPLLSDGEYGYRWGQLKECA